MLIVILAILWLTQVTLHRSDAQPWVPGPSFTAAPRRRILAANVQNHQRRWGTKMAAAINTPISSGPRWWGLWLLLKAMIPNAA